MSQNNKNKGNVKTTTPGNVKDSNKNKKTGINVTPKKKDVKDEVINEVLTPSEQPQENVETKPEELQTIVKDEASEQPQENAGTTPEEPKGDVKEEPKDIINETPRKVKIYWHKACNDEKKITNTTLKVDEYLRITDGKVTVPAPTADDANATVTLPVYSLKRGNRIYYLTDVTPSDIVKAEKVAKEKLANATPTPVTA
jgi:hypothetical protein